MKNKRERRAGYYKYYERADIKDYKLVWNITKEIIQKEGVPFSFNKRGRKPNLEPEECVCVSVLYVYFDDPFRETEKLLTLLTGKHLDHSNIVRWFGKLDERYVDRVAYKVHCKIIEINDEGDYIADSSGVTCDRYKSRLYRGEKLSEHITCKLHILGQYLFMIGLVSIVSVCASRGEANDYPFFKKLLKPRRVKSGRMCHADKAYFGRENIWLCKHAKIVPNIVPKNRDYSGITLRKSVKEYDNEARKKNRGLIETPFGGLETEMGMRTRCRKPKHRRIFVCLLALKHNIKTLIRAKALILLYYFRTNLVQTTNYINHLFFCICMTIKVKKLLKTLPRLKNPILVEGLPGIGNVGKVVVDFLVDELKAKKLCEIRSMSFPHSVFIDEKNMIEVPSVSLYYKKLNSNGKNEKRDILFLAGDVQPLEEEASYEFTYKILEMLKEFGGKELITIGGIGLPSVPEKPKVYCTGNSKEIVDKYVKGVDANKKIYGVVGPIIGVTGLLVGLAKEKEIKGICFLAETYNHPLYLGMKGSQKILNILNKKLGLGINLKEFGKEIEQVEKELMKRTKDLELASKQARLRKLSKGEASYIG